VSRLEPSDAALLAAYLLAAALGTSTGCLLLNDGAVFLTAIWLGDAWDLYFGQFAGRALALLLSFGPAWAARRLVDLPSAVFVPLAHVLYFAVPLAIWLVLRSIERQRVFSRLQLAIALPLVCFPSELVVGTGLWLIWLCLVCERTGGWRPALAVTLPMGAVLVFTHPVLALMSLLYLGVGGALAVFGRAVPRQSLIAAAAMTVLLLAGYLATSRLFAPSNPTIAFALGVNRDKYVDPAWMIATMVLFPMLAALWLLLLAPGTHAARLRWRFPPIAMLVVAAIGLWFAAAGTGLLTWVYSRHTAAHVLALAAALALANPTVWLAEARRPLVLHAAVMAVAALSYNIDLFVFGRFVDRFPGQGVVDVEANAGWPPQVEGPFGARVYFKWAAGPDYLRDVLVPGYDWYRVTLGPYSWFRSDRQRVLFHPLGKRGDWIPFQCGPVGRALERAPDAADRMFLDFLRQKYCVE
jgi:hypothetical protein